MRTSNGTRIPSTRLRPTFGSARESCTLSADREPRVERRTEDEQTDRRRRERSNKDGRGPGVFAHPRQRMGFRARQIHNGIPGGGDEFLTPTKPDRNQKKRPREAV